jgi:hypothetical protein
VIQPPQPPVSKPAPPPPPAAETRRSYRVRVGCVLTGAKCQKHA